jgi:hypothetical protein
MFKSVEFAIATTNVINNAPELASITKVMDGVAIHKNQYGSNVILVNKEWKILPLYILVKIIFPIVYFFKK